MALPILTTKFHVPSLRSKLVFRPRLIEQLNLDLWHKQGFGRKLTLISAPAGFGKTTLVSEWIHQKQEESGAVLSARAAWLSLDDGDNDPTRFITYLVGALQTLWPKLGMGVFSMLQSPQPPPTEVILTNLINEIVAITTNFILILDDYHVIENQEVDQILSFIIDNQPSQMHLLIASREDPDLPLARFRVRGELAELRAADLRFTLDEAAEFLNQVMGSNLSHEDITALETRTEGWIAGLQLAALALRGFAVQRSARQSTRSDRGKNNATDFIESFTGSHRFVLDYLMEEVLRQQPATIQEFLLKSSILDRMCGPLCDSILQDSQNSGQPTLEDLERSNLFIIPLDHERHWYRYHHLFGDLLRQRFEQSSKPEEIAMLHIRASEWYENNNLMFDAFRHAVKANDVERAEKLMRSSEMPLHFRSVAMAILAWLASLPEDVLDDRPVLRVTSATLALVAGQTTGVEEKLQAAEKSLQRAEQNDGNRDLIGRIACARATLALTHYDPETMRVQAHRALEYLHPDNLTFLFTANWVLSTAAFFKGDRVEAARACKEGVSISQKSGNPFSIVLSKNDLGQLQELDNHLHQAVETYKSVITIFGDHPQPSAADAHLGLARIYYEWNDLKIAEQHGVQSLKMARMYDQVIDRFIISEVFLARLKLAQNDIEGAAALLGQTEQTARQKNFVIRLPEIAAARALVSIRQGNLVSASDLSQEYNLQPIQARVLLAQGETTAALEVLKAFRHKVEEKGWADERLKVIVLQAIANHRHGEKDKAFQWMGEALSIAEPEGFIRLFVDEGEMMRSLLSDFRVSVELDPKLLSYIERILSAFPKSQPVINQPSEILTARELEVLQRIAQGLSNREIGEQLFLALDSVKGHNRRIYAKLQVGNRTEAVARARELGIL